MFSQFACLIGCKNIACHTITTIRYLWCRHRGGEGSSIPVFEKPGTILQVPCKTFCFMCERDFTRLLISIKRNGATYTDGVSSEFTNCVFVECSKDLYPNQSMTCRNASMPTVHLSKMNAIFRRWQDSSGRCDCDSSCSRMVSQSSSRTQARKMCGSFVRPNHAIISLSDLLLPYTTFN